MKITTRVKNAVNALTGTEKKAENSVSNIATDFLRYGNKNKPMLQDWSQVEMSDQDMYTGYSYAAIKKRANRASALGKKFLYTEGSKAIQEAAKKKDEELVHPYLKLIKESKEFTPRRFWHDISTYLDLEGVYYLMAVRAISTNKDGTTKVGAVQKLVMLNPYTVRKVTKESDGTVGGYIESKNGLYREIPKEMIIEVRLLNPFNNDLPFSMTDAAKESQFTMKQAGDYTRHSIKGNINTPGAITTDVELDDNVFDNFVSRIQNHSKGEPLYGNGAGAINWSAMQIDLDKAALDKINEIHRSILFAVSGTSKTTLGIEESGTTRDTSQVQKDNFTEDAVMPQVEDIIDALNLDYRKWYLEWEKDKYEIILDNPLESDREAELKDIEIRETELNLRDALVAKGYEYEIASRYAHGEISLEELGEPTLEEEITDEEADAIAMKEVGIQPGETDQEPEDGNDEKDIPNGAQNKVVAINGLVPKGFNEKKIKEAVKRAKALKKEQTAKLKADKKKSKETPAEGPIVDKPVEELKEEKPTETPKVEIVIKSENMLSSAEVPGLYDDMDIDMDKLGCIMINTEKIPLVQFIKDGKEDLHVKGKHTGLVGEEEPHATLLFGLLENGNTWKDKVDKVLDGWELPTVTIERVSYFELEDSNVIIGLLKKTDELVDGHERLTLLPHINTHSEYLPHISLAYLKKDVDVAKWIKPLSKKYNGQKVSTKGINYGDLPEPEDKKSDDDTDLKKKTKTDNRVEASLSHDCSEHESDINSTLIKAQNALEPAIQTQVSLQETDLYTSAQGLEAEIANAVIMAIRNGDYDEAEEILSAQQEKEFTDKLRLMLASYFFVLMPIYAKQLMDARLSEYNKQGIFGMTNDVEQYIDESSRKAAESHVNTVKKDLIDAVAAAHNQATESATVELIRRSVEAREATYLDKLPTNPNVEDITKAVKGGKFDGDKNLYKRARELAREGDGLDAITKAIQKEYQQISKNRARTIARHETNRVFNMAQYQADLQFLTENNLMPQAYKRLRNRANDPCPVCAELVDSTNANPIPFEKNFADLGSVLSANYKKKNGKMAVQTIPISYEAIKAGNIHVNCRCEYVLLVKQADGTFLNAVDHVAKNGGPGSSNFGHGGRPGQIGGSAGKGGSGGSTRTSKPSKKTLAGPKDQALREVEENESSSPSPDELYDYMDGNLPERAGDPYDSSDYDNSFEGKNEAGRTAWINDHVMQNTESDHDEEIANYVGKKDYSAINTYLRNPEYFSHPNHKDEVARLQPLIQKVKLATQADTVQKDMSTYRAGIFTEDYVNNLRPGTYIKDAGIVSTSMSAIYSTEFGARRLSANNKKAADGEAEWMGNVLFRVNSKAGQKGIYADTRRTAGGSEFEWIPAYGSNLYVTEAVKFTDSEGRFAGAIVDVDVYQESIPQGFIQTKLFENKLALNALAKATGDEDRFVWTEEDVELWVPEEEAENKYNPSQPRDKDGQWTDGGGSSSSSMSSIRAELAEKAKKKMYDGGVDDFISNEATHYRGETVERELPETGGDLGVGYYFTDNAWLAEKYSRGSDIVKRFVVDDSKALRLDDSVSAHKELTKSWYDQYRSEIPKAYDGSEMSYDLFAKQSDSVGNFLNWVYIEANPGRTSELDDTRNRFLEKSGFTGIEYDQASVLSVSLGEDYDAKNLLMFSKDSSLNEQDLTDIYNEARSTSNNSLEDKVENYSPSQPRDADGQWTDGGSGGGFTDLSGKNSYAVAKEMGFPDGNFDENPNYSEDEKTAVRYYGRIGNEPMNDILRYGGTTDPEERLARQRLKTLVDMKKQTLSKDVTLYRGAQLDQTLDIGDSVSDRAFVSTSFDKDIAREFATEQYESGNKYLFQINAPKGAEGIFVGQGHDWDEVEWVMDRGRDFKVQSISKPDDDGLITVGVNYE